MPLPLSRQPIGLLSFLGIKNGGTFPRWEDEPLILNQLDVTPWLLQDPVGEFQTTTSVAMAAVGVAGQQTAFTVPNGQIFVVTDALCYGNTGVGQTFQGYAYALNPVGAKLGLTDLTNVAAASSAFFAHAAQPGRVLILAPGTLVLGVSTQLVAGPVNMTVALRGTLLGI